MKFDLLNNLINDHYDKRYNENQILPNCKELTRLFTTMIKFIKSRINSVRYAIKGFWHVLKSQKNAHLHLIATVIVLSFGFWLQLSKQDWIFILLVIGIVWIAEFLNTALEIIVNLTNPDQHPLAKVGKDVGAAAVLIAAIISVAIGFLVFYPAIVHKFVK